MTQAPLRDQVEPFLNRRGPGALTRDPVSATAIRYFCEVVEDANPVYWDAEFAKSTRFGKLIAPPAGLMSLTFPPFWQPDFVRESTRRDDARLSEGEAFDPQQVMGVVMAAGYTSVTIVETTMEYLSPFGPDDGRIISEGIMLDVSEPKRTRVGEAVFLTNAVDYRAESDGRPIGRQITTLMLYNPNGPKKGA